MNDNELIDELRDSMRAHTDPIVVPQDFVSQAGRTARRRSARRAAAAGTPLLAAAGVAAVLVTSGGSGGAASHGAGVPSINVGNGQAHDTAYVVQRVRDNLGTAQSDVVRTVETGGSANAGADVTVTTWGYTDPRSGIEYESSAMASSSGTDIYDQFIVGTPVGNSARWQSTNVDPVQHLYAVTDSIGPQAPTLAEDIQQIKTELASGRATVDGTATVDGQPTIKLTMPAQMRGWTNTLYVNSRSYAPVKTFARAPGNAQGRSADTDTIIERWLPATTANAANAQLGQIPADYTQVSQPALEKANPAGR